MVGNFRSIKRRRLAGLFGLVAAMTIGLASFGLAADFPNRPITLIVPYDTGGPPDVMARIVAPKLSEKLGQKVIIENRVGGSGIVGTQIGMNAKPDGYTIMLQTVTSGVLNQLIKGHTIKFNLHDMTPITEIGTAPEILIVGSALPVKTTQDFVDVVKASPGKYKYVSSGVGSIVHLLGYLFTLRTGTEMVHIPYSSGADSVVAVAANEAQMRIGTIAGELPNIQGGKMKPLCVLSEHRQDLVPNVPTCEEAGIHDFVLSNWTALFGPANMSKEVVQRIGEAMQEVTKDPEYRKQLASVGVEPIGSSPSEFEARWKKEFDEWDAIVKSAGFKLD